MTNALVADSDRVIILNSKLPFKGKYKNKIGLMDPFQDGGINYAAIWIHPKLSKKNKLYVATHEAIHLAYPDLTEKEVENGSGIISEILWKIGYRKL